MPDHSDEDRRLLARCSKGDQDALRVLVDRYQSPVFNYTRRILGRREDAEEVAIESFTRLWKSSASFRGQCSVKSHLFRIAINLCRDRLRRQPGPPPMPQAGSSSAEDLYCAMANLPSDDRELLTLHYLDGLEYLEICDALGVSYDVVRTRLVRARARLRALMGVTDEA